MVAEEHKQKSLATLLYADRVALVYRLAPLSIVSTPFIGLFAWWTALQVSPAQPVNSWYIALLAVCFGRAVLIFSYRKAAPAPIGASRWARRFVIGVFASGAIWGIGGGLLFSAGDPLARLVLAFLLPGLAAGNIGLLGPFKSAYYAYVLPLVTPLALHLVLSGDMAFTGIGLFSAVFTVVLMAAAARHSKTVAESLQLRFEKFALLDRLTHSSERLTWTNNRLQREANERVNAENIAKEQAKRLALYIEQTPLAVVETDLQYRVMAWNPAAESMFEYKRAEIIGRNVLEILVARDQQNAARNFIANLAGGKHSGSGPLQLVTGSGRMMIGEWHLSVIQDSAGNAIGLAAAVQDITERKQLDRMKNEFITTVIGELHGPLHAMRTAMSTLMGGQAGQFESQAMNLLRSVQGHCERLANLTETMLDVERMEVGSGGLILQHVSLAELARRAVAECRVLADLREVRVNFLEPEGDAIVHVDADRLLQVFTSLIHNAIKFSPEGGQVQIGMSVDETQARVSIADRRAAIPNDFQTRIMQKFSSAQDESIQAGNDISLGLFVSKRLVEKHGGKFSLKSYHNVGNIFHIELPRLAPAVADQNSVTATV